MTFLRYSGSIAFEKFDFAVISKKFDLVDDDLILINWQSAPAEEDFYQFLGVAQKISKDTFITPWVHVTDKDGVELPKDENGNHWIVKIEFTITNMAEHEISIEGRWLDFSKVEFPFSTRFTKVNS